MRILALDNSTNKIGWAVFDGLELERSLYESIN